MNFIMQNSRSLKEAFDFLFILLIESAVPVLLSFCVWFLFL